MFNKFEFSGFKPKMDLALYANVMLFQITDYIAGQFTSLGTLAKKGGKYVCLLKVCLPMKTFFEETSSEDPKAALDRTNQKIKKRISDYNTKRFQITSSLFWEPP